MTENEAALRTMVSEALLAVVFSMRTDDGPAGQAWILDVATTVASRAVLGVIGPRGDAAPVLEVLNAQVAKKIDEIQRAAVMRTLAQGVTR